MIIWAHLWWDRAVPLCLTVCWLVLRPRHHVLVPKVACAPSFPSHRFTDEFSPVRLDSMARAKVDFEQLEEADLDYAGGLGAHPWQPDCRPSACSLATPCPQDAAFCFAGSSVPALVLLLQATWPSWPGCARG